MSEPAREIPVSAARERLADVVNAVVYGGSITYLTRHGRRLAAIVSAQVAEDIERQRADSGAGNGRRLRAILERHPPDDEWGRELAELRAMLKDEGSRWPDD